MVAIGLLDIPPEIQLQVAEFVATSEALKALSVTSRSLRCIAQSELFKTFIIDLDKELKGSIDDLLANPRICAAIRLLSLRGTRTPSTTSPHNHEERLSLVKKLLPAMIGLRAVRICWVRLSRAFMDDFLEVAANTRLRVSLRRNIYPPGTNPAFNTPLRLYRLSLASVPTVPDHTTRDFYQSVLRASATTLTELIMDIHGDQLMGLVDIDLPFLHDLTLKVPSDNEVSRASVAAFIIAQRTIRKLEVRSESGPLPAIPPDALPNLRRLSASAELINQLVPGRPVEAIDVRKKGRDWFGEEVARSTAGVRKLEVRSIIGILDLGMLERAVAILPSLESLCLPVFNNTFLEVIEILTSLKYLTHLHIDLFHYIRGIHVNYSINIIVAKLRTANSCFSCIEISENSANGSTAFSLWSEASGIIYDKESVSTLGDFPSLALAF